MITNEEMGGERHISELRDQQMQTIIYKIDKQQGPTVGKMSE